jgi:hypothetical protein
MPHTSSPYLTCLIEETEVKTCVIDTIIKEYLDIK